MDATIENTAEDESHDLDYMRVLALARHLDLENDGADDLEPAKYDARTIEYGRHQYLVLTDEEADEQARTYMQDTLWAFSTTFLSRYVPALRDARAAKAWGKVVGDLCEDASPLVEALLGDRLEEALDDAISEDGREHFLASYDGAEYDEKVYGTDFYIYRVN